MTRLPAFLLTLVLLGTAASANTMYWGGGTANIPNGTILPTNLTTFSGTWDLTTANWSTTTNGTAYTNWPSTGTSNTAYFGKGLGIIPFRTANGYVTQAVNMAVNQLAVMIPDSSFTIYFSSPTPVSLTLNGANPTIASTWSDGRYGYLSFEPNVALAGTNGFTMTGTGEVLIHNNSSGLSGTVVVANGGYLQLLLQNGGKLTGVNRFILEQVGDQNGFAVYVNAGGARDDLRDTCEVRLQGGQFGYFGFKHATAPSVETIGTIVLDSWGVLNPIGAAGGSGAKGRLYTAIDRGPNGKGMLSVGAYNEGTEPPPSFDTDIIVTNYPTGVILPWMSHTRGMPMMLTPAGAITNVVMTLAPRDLATWQPNQDYRAFSSQAANDVFSNSISSNLTINSLGAQLNLNNLNNQTITIGATNTLTISSGYIGMGWDGRTYNGGGLTIAGGSLTTTTNDLYLSSGQSVLAGLVINSAITGAINVVAGGLSAQGYTCVALGGATTNSYTGTTYIQGLLNLSKPNNVIAIPGNVDIGTYGWVNVNYNEQIANTASVMNRGTIYFNVNGSPNQTFSNVFTNQGGTIREASAGNITLNASGTGFAFNGGLCTVIYSGIYIRLLTDVSYDASTAQQAIFSGLGSIYLADGASATRTFNVADSTTMSEAYSEMVAGLPFAQNGGGVVANLHKTGSGVLEMTAMHTYTGTNTIDAGTLLANSARSTGYGVVIVTNSGTLGGTGIVLGAVSVYSGASLMPGVSASAGTLTVSNNVNLKSGATFNVDMASGGNSLLICSNLTLAGYVTPNPLPGYTIPYSGTWTIATVLGSGTIDKTGATTPSGYILKVTGANLILSKPSTGTICFWK